MDTNRVRRRRGRRARMRETLLLTLCSLLLLGCVCGIGYKLWELYQARERIATLQARMHAPQQAAIITIRLATDAKAGASAAPVPTLPPEPAGPTQEELARCGRLAALSRENPELIGWIALDGTQIDYPVMQSVDRPWHYLDHDFSGARSKSGLPFLDEACDAAGNRANFIIYGHNMKNGSMFGGLHKLTDRAFYDAHRVIRFDTPERAGSYRIASVFYMEVDEGAAFQFYRFPNLTDEATFLHYAEQVTSDSLYPADVPLLWGDELLTLVTCSKHAADGRFVVVAKRVG